jgi:hypothetical protein
VNDDKRDLTNEQIAHLVTDALVGEFRPFREITERLMTLVEQLARRVEVLELERMRDQAPT